MDLNYLLHRQQIERFGAQSGSCDQARRAHAQLADLYERAVEDLAKGKAGSGAAYGHLIH